MDVTFNTGVLVSVLTCASTLIGIIWWAFKLYGRMQHVEKQCADQKKDIQTLLQVCLAMLSGLKELGCDGEVSKAYEKLVVQLTNH